MFNKLLRPIARCAVQRASISQTSAARGGHGHHENELRHVTLDDAPKPAPGTWQENYEKQQRKHNTQFLVGASALIITILAVCFKI